MNLAPLRLATAACVLFACLSAKAETCWHVDAVRGDDSNDGSGWDVAKRSIQAAVDVAEDGDVIYVEAGAYESISTGDKRICIESMNGAELTFIDGGGTNRCATLSHSIEGTNSVLVGFTLTNGYAKNNGGGSFGGTLDRCIISRCMAKGDDGDCAGGGAYHGCLNNCLVVGNFATSTLHRAYGGGAYRSILRSCTVVRNVATGGGLAYGGGICECSAYNTIVWANSAVASQAYGADAHGGSLYSSCADSNPLFVDADAGDFHLGVESPCLDAGSDAYVVGNMDLDWDDRVQGTAVDMGCYEGAEQSAPPGQVTGLVMVDGVLSWNSMPGAEGYVIYRSTRRVVTSAKSIGVSYVNSYVDETAVEGERYYYWVRAFNALGSGDFSGFVEYTWPLPLAIKTKGLPDGRVHDEYSVQLEALGGKSPYRWELVTPKYSVYTNTPSTFSETGFAQDWYGDDYCWVLELPFDFQFYGRVYRKAYVSSNGTISFGNVIYDQSYNANTFRGNTMIAVLWKNLETVEGGDIYVDASPESVKISWVAAYYSRWGYGYGNPVNASATLYADGHVVLSYGSGNKNGGFCGFSAGDGIRYAVARNNSTSWDNAGDIVFTKTGYDTGASTLPNGLTFTDGGGLSGIAKESGKFIAYARVTDDDGDSIVAEFPFTIEKNVWVFHVDAANGDDENDGLSAVSAKRTIQAAIDLDDIFDDDVILVADGVYPPIDTSGKCIVIKSINGKANTVIDGGGEMQCAYLGYSTLVGFTLTNGYSDYGGGVMYGMLIDCDIVGNTATIQGGGIYGSEAVYCRVANNIVTNDSSKVYGGGMYGGTLESCLVVGNRAIGSESYGGGAYYGYLYNCTVVGNSAAGSSPSGGGAYTCELYSTIVYANSAADSESEVEGDSLDYCCLIGEDPGFVDFEGGNYHLSADSPCIDDGSNSYVLYDYDLDGNVRIQNYSVDIGCYEYGSPQLHETTAADFSAQLNGTCYGVFVGVNKYIKWASLYGCVHDATNMQARCVGKGYWKAENATVYLDSAATKAVVRAKLSVLSSTSVAGDTVLYYHSSHGGNNGLDEDGVMTRDTCLCLYDDEYQDEEMAEDLMKFAAGVKVVVILDTCHSAGMFKGTKTVGRGGLDASCAASGIAFAQRVRELMAEKNRSRLRKGAKSGISADDIGWIAAANYNQYSFDGYDGGVFTGAILDGWKTGAADYDGDKHLNFHELWRYAKERAVGYVSLGTDYVTDAQCLNENVLLSRFAGIADYPGEGEMTKTSPTPVALNWLNGYPELLAEHGGDYEVAANAQSPGADGSGGKTWPNGSPCYVWQDYVSGTSPTNDVVFKATIRMEGTTPVIEWDPHTDELDAKRVYRTFGRTSLDDADRWSDVTDSDKTGYQFFKVTVDLP